MDSPSILLTTLNAKYIHLNLAIRLLYELNKHDRRLAWKEFTIKEEQSAVAEYCRSFEVVCFSCYIWNITPTLSLARQLKNLRPDIKILLGGPEVSYDWEAVLRLPFVDYIITGEGETPFAEFLRLYPDVNNIDNLAAKKGASIQYHSQAAAFDLTNYEHTNPYQNEDPASLYNRIVYVETSRGCPYHCEFCLASLDNRVRQLPEAHIQSNLRYVMQHGRVIKFLDRTFNLRKDLTLQRFRFLLDHAGPQHVFQFEITADILHPDIIRFIREEVPRGLFRFEIGIQSVNEKANHAVRRKQQFEKIKEVILQVQDYVELHLDLIIGLPHDYLADIKFSFEEVFRLFAPELQLGFLKFLKGTPVRHDHLQHGYVFRKEAPYQIIKSNYLSATELEQLELLEQVLEIYWNKKRLPYTLKYVTGQHSIFDFLQQLGVYFNERGNFLRHGLKEVFQLAWDFCSAHYPDDCLLKELITLDYYLYPKIKPAPQFLVMGNAKEQYLLMEQWHLPHRRFRYALIPVSFNFDTLVAQNRMVPDRQWVVIEYNGQTRPRVFTKIRNTPSVLPVMP